MKAVVVLLHSSAASARQWDALAALLAERFEVHAIDLHGHGERAPWAGAAAPTLADEAALVEPLLQRAVRAGSGVHLVGHSYGGAVALEVARRHGRAVRSVAVYEPVLFGLLFADARSAGETQSVRALAASVHTLVDAGRERDAAERFVDYWSGAGAWAQLARSRQDGVARRMRAVASHFDAAVAAADPRPALTAGAVPLLALAGERSVAPTRRIAALLRASLAHAEHACLPGAGHMGPLTHAAAVNARIADFLLRQAERQRAKTLLSIPATTIA